MANACEAKEITWPQQHRIIISPDRTAALKGLSALMYENEVKAQQQVNQKAEEEKKQQAAKEAEEKKAREEAEKQKKAEEAKAKSETMKAAAFYTVVATLTSDYETSIRPLYAGQRIRPYDRSSRNLRQRQGRRPHRRIQQRTCQAWQGCSIR